MICNDDQVRPALHGQELGLGGLHRLLASQLTGHLRHGFTFTFNNLHNGEKLCDYACSDPSSFRKHLKTNAPSVTTPRLTQAI